MEIAVEVAAEMTNFIVLQSSLMKGLLKFLAESVVTALSLSL
jgi:hypothetical protein